MEVFVRMEGLGTKASDKPKTIMLGKQKCWRYVHQVELIKFFRVITMLRPFLNRMP